MSDPEDCDFINVPAETPLSPDEAISRRHKREKKELQGKILSIKKNVNKADKKKKKEIAEEIIKLEAELETRQKAELDAFRPGRLEPFSVPSTLSESEEVQSIDSSIGKANGPTKPSNPSVVFEDADNSIGSAPGTPKMSRARRRREKKEAEERDKQKRVEAESSVLLEGSQMKAEDDVFERMMKDFSLEIIDIEPDGNCLYNAVKDQLKRCGEIMETKSLRTLTAEYLRSHKDEFILFLDEGYSGSDEGFQRYCNELETTPAWGGQVEVRILSQVLHRPIKVLQAEGQPVLFGEHFDKEPLVLTYHRYKYQLGEHYNSTIAATSTS